MTDEDLILFYTAAARAGRGAASWLDVVQLYFNVEFAADFRGKATLEQAVAAGSVTTIHYAPPGGLLFSPAGLVMNEDTGLQLSHVSSVESCLFILFSGHTLGANSAPVLLMDSITGGTGYRVLADVRAYVEGTTAAIHPAGAALYNLGLVRGRAYADGALTGTVTPAAPLGLPVDLGYFVASRLPRMTVAAVLAGTRTGTGTDDEAAAALALAWQAKM